MSKVVLIIIFNHNYASNLVKLRKIYANRFSNIWFVVPFYTGNEENVIPVFDSSFYFQGFVATAISKIGKDNYDHYIAIADDLFLNPDINESNYTKHFQVDKQSGFISNFFDLNNPREHRPSRPYAPFWNAILAGLTFKFNKGFEWNNYLPSCQNADKLLKKHGINNTNSINLRMLFPFEPIKIRLKKSALKYSYHGLKICLSNLKYLFINRKLSYPMVGGYSDLVIIPKHAVDNFIIYAQAFSAANLFVELALPTALLLSCDKISTEDNIELKCTTYWFPESSELTWAEYHTLAEIKEKFPKDTLYIHPVKLTKINL